MSATGRGEHDRRRPVRRWMMRPSVLAGLGGGLLVAVFVGVSLGNAAVEGINPAHYRAPPVPRPRPPVATDPAAGTLARRMPSHGELYGWDASEMARAVTCGAECEGEGIYSARVPYFGSREELAEAERAALKAIDDAFAGTGEGPGSGKARETRRPVRIEIDPPYAEAVPYIEETIAVGDQE